MIEHDRFAKAGDIAPRYAREWLEQQYAAGVVEGEDPTLVEDARRYVLSPEHAEVLTDADSPYYLGAHSMQLAGVVQVVPSLLQAFREGSGVPYGAYGSELRRDIAAGNRPMFLHELGSSWLPAMPDVDERLRSAPSAVLDLGDPVSVLRSAGEVLVPGGSVLVADERVADTFGPGADLVERLNYAYSVLHCLPATLAESPVEVNGTVLRAPTVRRWTASAGLQCEVLPIENDFWRFYRLRA